MAELVCCGLLGWVGILLVVSRLPVLHRPRLEDRLAPYLAPVSPPSALLSDRTPGGAWVQLAAQLARDVTAVADTVLGGRGRLQRRLDQLADPSLTVERFRQQQVLAGGAGALCGLSLLALGPAAADHVPAVSLLGLTVLLAAAGVWSRDYLLSRALGRRRRALESELPGVAELLALAVGAGEAPAAALERVARVSGGELGSELHRVIGDVRAGATLSDALSALPARTQVPALSRFVDGIRVAVSRGTPLADVLRAQAADAREAGKRTLIEAGGRAEIRMLVPVVFLILPVILVFALFPGAVTLSSLTH